MNPFYIFTALVLLLPVAGLWPFYDTKHYGRGASNSLFWISMPPRSAYGGDRLQWKAVFAEELVEFYVRWLCGLIPAHVVVALAGQVGGYYANLTAIFGAAACMVWTGTAFGYRFLEYFGKTAFAAVRGVPAESEAEFLHHAYPQFHGVPIGAIARNLRRAAPLSRALVVLLSLNLRRAA